MEPDKEYNDFIALGNKCYPNQDKRGITNFNSKVVENIYPKKKDLLDDYGLSKCEFFVLIMMEGFFSEKIQLPLLHNRTSNEFIERCIFYFDSFLSKTPKTLSDVIYRQDNFNSVEFYEDLKKNGKHYICSSFLTASKDDFDNSRNVKLIITPKVNGETKAHDVYLILNHGENNKGAIPEYQINFERNAEFEITRIDKNHKIPVAYLNEV